VNRAGLPVRLPPVDRLTSRLAVAALTLPLTLAGCVTAASPAASGTTPSLGPSTVPLVSAPSPVATESPGTDPLLTPLPSIDVTGLDSATAAAVSKRISWGLPADLEAIKRAASDPASIPDYGTPLTPNEVRTLEARSERAHQVGVIVQTYADDYLSEYGGDWIDQARGGLVVASFTAHVAEHRDALKRLVGDVGEVAVVAARYPESRLRDLQDRIADDRTWYEAIPASLQSIGVDTIGNVVEVHVSTANPNIADLIAARSGGPPDALRVISDGTGIALEPWGKIHGKVVGVPRTVLAELTLNYHSDRAGAGCGIGDVGIGIAANGTFDLPCQGGHWTITAGRDLNDIVASGEVDLPPGGTASMVLRPVGH
jgi:hypothetical protein